MFCWQIFKASHTNFWSILTSAMTNFDDVLNAPLVFLTCFVALISAFTCYYPDGEPNEDESYQPCGSGSADDQFTMCCATFRQAPDQCLKSGLCSNTATGPNLTWRESCTDPTWKSPSCIKICDTGIGKTDNYLNPRALRLM